MARQFVIGIIFIFVELVMDYILFTTYLRNKHGISRKIFIKSMKNMIKHRENGSQYRRLWNHVISLNELYIIMFIIIAIISSVPMSVVWDMYTSFLKRFIGLIASLVLFIAMNWMYILKYFDYFYNWTKETASLICKIDDEDDF